MSPRRKLADRREQSTLNIVAHNLEWRVSFARYDDGGLAEVFVAGAKAGDGMEAIARDAAVVLSLALQFGTPLTVIREALTRDDRDKPSGLIGVILDQVEALQ